MAYEDAIQTANKRSLSANGNFKRIVEGLKKQFSVAEGDDEQILHDAIELLRQQNAEIHAAHESQRC